MGLTDFGGNIASLFRLFKTNLASDFTACHNPLVYSEVQALLDFEL